MTRIKYHQLLKKCEVLNDVFYFDVMFKELLFQSDLDIDQTSVYIAGNYGLERALSFHTGTFYGRAFQFSRELSDCSL